MATTVSTFKTRIRKRLGERTSLDDFLIEFLNTAQTRVARRHRFSDLRARNTTFSLTASTRLYNYADVATDCKTILSITLEDKAVKIGHAPLEIFDAWIPDPTDESEAEPQWWYPASKTQFGFHPVPDTTYTAWIRYTSWASTLSADTDTVSYEDIDDVILYGALVEAYAALQEWEDVQNADALFEQRLREAASNDMRQPDHFLVLGQYRPPGERHVEQGDPWAGRSKV